MFFMKMRWLWVVLLFSVATLARATTVIYPVDAIDDLWQLPADEFRQKYSGINISGMGPSDEGWYVRYRHENLTYLFGPLPEREDARKKMWDLETVRDAAIRNRPVLTSSRVDFVRFTYSGVYGKGGGDSPYGGAGTARVSKDGKSGPDGDLDGDGIPNSKDEDMDGDGIANGGDPDADGDGTPNGKDDYAFGDNPGPDGNGLAKDGWGKGGAGKDGKAGDGDKDGTGKGDGDKDGHGQGGKLAGLDGPGGDGGDQAGGEKGGKGAKGGKKGGKGGQAGDSGSEGGDGSEGGQQGSAGQKGRQVASNQRGNQSGSQGGQQGQQGGQQGQQGGQQGQQGQPGGGDSGQSGSSGGGGNPLQILSQLLRMILGI
ncbi:MAG: hypothetical protein EXS38_05465 [Opitutus sp.]|nr:hypothetical protein [Opitutus sp.]